MASIEDANSNGERPGIPVLVRLEEEREADNSACTDLEMLAFICRLLEDFFLLWERKALLQYGESLECLPILFHGSMQL